MRKKGVARELQCHVREYLDYIWHESPEDLGAEEIILNQLSDVLRE